MGRGVRLIVKGPFTVVLYLATMFHHTAEPRGRPAASSMHHIIFIKTENIAVDEIGRIICSYLLARAQQYFLYKIIMHA